jgi:hypothetical protein
VTADIALVYIRKNIFFQSDKTSLWLLLQQVLKGILFGDYLEKKGLGFCGGSKREEQGLK